MQKDDVIYRQAAVDEFKSYGNKVNTATQLWTIMGCAEIIRNLPYAQSETCAYWDRESNICALHRPSAQPDIEQAYKQGWDDCRKALEEEQWEYVRERFD